VDDASQYEALVAKDGQPFRTLSVSFASEREMKESDYLVNVAFTEGSRLFYTGHFAIRSLGCKAPCRPDELTASDCNLSCDGFLTLYPPCSNEYFTALDCAVQTPADWSCEPNGGPQFDGPSCASERAVLTGCVQ
jgi:hypothetical protein